MASRQTRSNTGVEEGLCVLTLDSECGRLSRDLGTDGPMDDGHTDRTGSLGEQNGSAR